MYINNSHVYLCLQKQTFTNEKNRLYNYKKWQK